MTSGHGDATVIKSEWYVTMKVARAITGHRENAYEAEYCDSATSEKSIT
jgi:hypothetical protein